LQKLAEQIETDPIERGGPRRWLLSVAVAIAVGTAYFLAAQLSLALLTAAERVAVFWPASGVAAGALVALGRWARVPVALAVIISSVAAALTSDRNVWSAIAFGFFNAGEALVLVWLLERWFGAAFTLDSLRRVLGFFAAAAVATAAVAVGATGAMQAFGPSSAAFIDVWKVWFVSDALGVITVAPLLIGVAAALRDPPSSRELLEGTVVVGGVAVTIVLLLSILSGPWSLIGPSGILFPLLLWLGYRCRPVFAAAAVFTIAAAIVLTTTHEFGRYGDPVQPIGIRVVAAQILMLGTALAALALAALFAERRRHEATIVASEARLRSILRAANVIAWDVDLIRNTVDATGPVGRLVDRPGSEPHDFAGIVESIHPEDRDRVMAQFWKAVSTNAAYELEFRLCSSGGSARWVTAEGLIERDSIGRPVRVRGITRDVTSRKQAEQGLQESERKLRELLGALPAAIHTTDTAGRITFCNKAAVDLWGVSPEIGKDKCSDLGRMYYPDGTLMPADASPTKLCLRERRAVVGRETIFERPDGRRIPVIPCPAPLTDEEGEVVGVVSMKLDISELKKAERALAERNIQLALAGKAALVGSFAYDTDTEIMQISEGYAALHGLPEGTVEMARSECLATVHPGDIEQVRHLRTEAFDACRHEYSVEYRIVRAGAEVRWVETRCFISYDGEGHAHRVVGVSIDITERKRVEEQQRKLVAELDHRVKNVLATVQAVAAHTMDASGSMEHFVAALDGRIRSMGSTHELLSHRRWLGIPLAELVQRELAPYTTGANTEISGPEVMLSAEAGQVMAMVLHELATNAAKYGALSSPSGQVSIGWRLSRNGSASDRLVFKWRETGGPLIVSPRKSSYGMHVVRELVPYELGGTVDYVLSPEGAHCQMAIPLAQLGCGSSHANGSVQEPFLRSDAIGKPQAG
jgi:PAS domain S-box-containing protein